MHRLLFIIFCSAFAQAAEIRLNDEILNVELASNSADRTLGLMGRSTLPEGQGMLFVYEKPQRLSFWMKNTRIPLDIGFFDATRRLIQIDHMDPPQNGRLPVYRCPKMAQYALEVPQGWFERHNIELSTRLEWEKSLR